MNGEIQPLPPGEYMLETDARGNSFIAEGPFKGRYIALSAFYLSGFPKPKEGRSKVTITSEKVQP